VVGAGDGLSLASTSHRDTSLLFIWISQKFETFDHTRPCVFSFLFSMTVFYYHFSKTALGFLFWPVLIVSLTCGIGIDSWLS
jgi:hypothetical protein